VKYSTYSKPDFIPKLGGAIASIIESIPSGGVLVFLPSYSFLRKCVNAWNPFASRRGRFNRFASQSESDVWDRIEESKGKIIVEESGGSQGRFEQSRNEYNETVRTQGSCVLFAVYRGKMSEGVSFNDDYARGVICVGIPLPNSYDMSIRSKKNYNNEQRRLRNRTNLLPGDDWYQQQAYRAIAQALGRCIRHASDYGTIVLLDSRHCDDGSPSLDGVCAAHKNLPKWMRHHVKNLDRNRRAVGGMHQFLSSNPDAKFIHGGWNGLAQEMKRFFREAKPHAASVLENHQAKLAKAQALDRQKAAQGRKFDSKTGTWSSNSTDDNSTTSPTTSLLSTTIKINPCSSLTSQPVEAEAPKQASASTATAVSSVSVSSARTHCSNPQTQAASRMITTTPSSGAPAAGAQYLSSRERIQRACPPKKPPRNTLKAMFHRQRSAAENTTAHGGASTPGPTPQSMQQQQQQQQQQQLSQLTASSPAAAMNLGSALKATATSQGASAASSQQDEDAYCIICEEETKRVVLLPCKHLCVCSACSKLEKLVDCPMCRTKIEDKMEVFM
jgi:Fanconi anemia group J protein